MSKIKLDVQIKLAFVQAAVANRVYDISFVTAEAVYKVAFGQPQRLHHRATEIVMAFIMLHLPIGI